jgi:2-polyprenyl-3-methyl-5-hydroxy-6-metoxy-1,4-benzoquinol methylase
MASIKDDRGFNQGFEEVPSTVIRFERRADKMIAEMEIAPDKTVLEIGCGTGRVAHFIAEKTGMNILGTDLCEPFVEEANRNYANDKLRFEVLDFNNPVQVAGRKFDYIVGNGILHHLYYNLDQVLATMRDLLNTNGKIIFWEPNLYNPYIYFIFSYESLRKKANLEPDEMAFTNSFIAKKLEAVNYRNVKVEFRDFLLPGIPEFLVKPSIAVGDIIERVPLANRVSQSLFIVAQK